MKANPYQDVAKEFLDVWQKQIASMVGDKQFIQAFLEMFQNMQKQNYAHTQTSNPASNSAATPDAGNDMLAQLTFRLAMCEKRIATLESEKTVSKKPESRKTAKRSSE
jgi:hypothetical protein